MSRVNETGAEVTITKHGRPVTKLVVLWWCWVVSSSDSARKQLEAEVWWFLPADLFDEEWDLTRGSGPTYSEVERWDVARSGRNAR